MEAKMMEKSELILENEMLKRKLFEMKAGAVSNAHFVLPKLKKLGKETMMGSSVIIQFSTLGNKIDIMPISIADGLSKETIDALEKDIRRNFEHITCYHPDGLKAIPEFE